MVYLFQFFLPLKDSTNPWEMRENGLPILASSALSTADLQEYQKIFRAHEISLWFKSSQLRFILAINCWWCYKTIWENICPIHIIEWFTTCFVKTLYNLKRILRFLNVL